MLRYLVIYIIVFFNFCFQTTWFNSLNVFGLRVNTMLLFIIFFALQGGEKEGAAIGFFSGLLQDIIVGRIFGFYSLMGIILGFVCGYLNRRFVKDNSIVAVLFSFIGTLLYEFTIYVVFFLSKGYYSINNYFFKYILSVSIGNLIISFFIFKFTLYLDSKYKPKKVPEF